MNERIRDFYDQVGLDFENFQRVTVTKGDMEKFAMLIVRECATHLHQRGVESFGILEERNLKQHFGVEE